MISSYNMVTETTACSQQLLHIHSNCNIFPTAAIQNVHSNCNIFTTAVTCSQQLQRDHYNSCNIFSSSCIMFTTVWYYILCRNFLQHQIIVVLIPKAAWFTLRSSTCLNFLDLQENLIFTRLRDSQISSGGSQFHKLWWEQSSLIFIYHNTIHSPLPLHNRLGGKNSHIM